MDIKKIIRESLEYITGNDTIHLGAEDAELEKLMTAITKYMHFRLPDFVFPNDDNPMSYARSRSGHVAQEYILNFLGSRFNQYIKIGSGAYGIVLMHKRNPNKVFKIIFDDNAYLEYAHACMKYKYEWMPVIHDIGVVSFFRGDKFACSCHIISMECLDTLEMHDAWADYPTSKISETIRTLCRHVDGDFYAKSTELKFFQDENSKRTYKRGTLKVEKEARHVFFELNKKFAFSWDVRRPNVMIRWADNKQVQVITDPIHNAEYR